MLDWLSSLGMALTQTLGRLLNPLLRTLRPLINRGVTASRPLRERWHAFYDKREPREKLLLRVAATVFGLFFIYNFVYLPIIGLETELGDRVEVRRRDLIEVRSLMQSYDRLNREMAAAQRRTLPGGPDFSLFSVVEQTLTTTAGRDRIGSITPSDHPVPGGFRQYSVDIKLNGITLQQIVDTLYGVQSLAMPITISHLEIHQQAQNTHSFDVEMTCMALGKDGSAGH